MLPTGIPLHGNAGVPATARGEPPAAEGDGGLAQSRVSPKLFIQDACFFNAPVWLSDSQELKEAMFNCSSTDTETLKSLIPTAQTPNPEDVGLRRRRHYDRNGCKHDRIAGARAAALESLC